MLVASMRPGQLTPENLLSFDGLDFPHCGFNEAGAINPGKRVIIIDVVPRFAVLQ